MLVPVLEAYSSLCVVMADNLSPLRPDLTFPRLVRIAETVLALSRQAEERGTDAPNVDPLVIVFDIMDCIVGAAGDKSNDLIRASPSLVSTLSECL